MSRNPYQPPESQLLSVATRPVFGFAIKWRKVLKYAIALLVAQSGIGFLEGYLSPPSSAVLLSGAAASFIVCGAIFAHLGAYQQNNPFVHAWAALVLQVAAGSVLAEVFARSMSLIGRTTLFFIFFELVVSIFALVVGTFLGTKLRCGKAGNQRMPNKCMKYAVSRPTRKGPRAFARGLCTALATEEPSIQP